MKIKYIFYALIIILGFLVGFAFGQVDFGQNKEPTQNGYSLPSNPKNASSQANINPLASLTADNSIVTQLFTQTVESLPLSTNTPSIKRATPTLAYTATDVIPTPAGTVTPSPIRVFYVSKQGNDNNSGDETSPWRTVGYAVAKAEPGDKILFHEGVYHEMFAIKNKNGTEENPIVFQAVPGENVVIQTIDWAGFYITGSSWIVVDGFQVTKAPYDGINVTNSHNIVVQNCESYENKGIGILVNSLDGPSNDNFIYKNVVHDNGWEGIYVTVKTKNPVAVNNNIIMQNKIYGNRFDGIQNTNQNGGLPTPNGTQIIGNDVQNNNLGPDWAEMDIVGDNILIEGNYVVNSHSMSGGIYFTKGSNTIIRNNEVHNTFLTWQWGNAIILDRVGGPTTVTGNKLFSTIGDGVDGIAILGSSDPITLSDNTYTNSQ